MNLNNVKIFVVVAGKGSFSQAARELDMPVSSVSRKVSELEKELELRLLERSTRKLRLTDAGEQFFHFASRGLHELEMGMQAMQEKQQLLKGVLRVSLPSHYEPCWGLLEAFTEKYPDIELVINATPSKLDLIDENIDVAMRVGDIKTLSFVARKLFSYRHRVVAAQSFARGHGLPQRPEQLSEYACIFWGIPNSASVWQFGEQMVAIEPVVISNEFLFIKRLVSAGKGIAELPPFFCEQEIASGEFIELFSDTPLPEQDLYLLYPSRKQLSKLARAYIDFCVSYFQCY